MTGRASRRKGAEGEREVAKILERYGFHARRTPNSGGLSIKGDLTGHLGEPAIPGYHIEVKRCETILLPKWLRQAHADAGRNTPLLIFRTSKGQANDPLGYWHATLPLEDLLALLGIAREGFEAGWAA